MDLPKYVQTLLAYKWLLLVGIVIAVIAGLLATFTLVNGQLVTRTAKSYRAASTILISDRTRPLYQAQFSVPIPKPTAKATTEFRDLNSVATVYAYIISGSEVRAEVESQLGALRPGEAILAVQRTTQPGTDSTSQGRLSLPLLDVVGVSPMAARAEKIAQTANEIFQAKARAQQTAQKLKPNERVDFLTVDNGTAAEQDTTNPAVPGVAAGLGVLVIFALLVFVIDNIRRGRRAAATPGSRRETRRRAERAPGAEARSVTPARPGQIAPPASPVEDSAFSTAGAGHAEG